MNRRILKYRIVTSIILILLLVVSIFIASYPLIITQNKGLLFDVIGVIIISIWGFPFTLGPSVSSVELVAGKEQRWLLSRIGIVYLIIGFFLQWN